MTAILFFLDSINFNPTIYMQREVPRVVENPDGTRSVVSGLPYEIALRIVMSTLNNHEEERILRYLEQLTPEEQAALRLEIETSGAAETQTLLERARSYLPAGMVAALSYYLKPRSNP
jgi:hypothetical protein